VVLGGSGEVDRVSLGVADVARFGVVSLGGLETAGEGGRGLGWRMWRGSAWCRWAGSCLPAKAARDWGGVGRFGVVSWVARSGSAAAGC
jgi:hypothetical protein